MKSIKSILWFLVSPIRRRAWLTSPRLRSLAKCLHYSTRVQSADAIYWHSTTKIGRNTQIDITKSDASIKFTQNSWVGDDCELTTSGSLTIGFASSIQHRSILIGDVTIGHGCVCAANLYISSYSHRFEDLPSWPIRWQDEYAAKNQSSSDLSQPVSIGDDCWIGTNVVVMPGVEIGRGAVIGANAVVTRNVPPYAVMAGVPAKVIKQRFVFSPPSEITASIENDIPYFYRGFQMWRNGLDLLSNFEKPKGWFADEEFELMLTLEGATTLRLYMFITDHIILDAGFGEAIMKTSDGYVDILCYSNSTKAIKVKWKSVDVRSKDAQVYVMSAKLIKI